MSVQVYFSAATGERLYSAGEVAALLGMTPSAVSNYQRRDRQRVPFPAPAVIVPHPKRDRCYWTGDQLSELLRARHTRAAAILAQLEARLLSARERAEESRRALVRFGADASVGRGTESRNEGRIGP